MSVEPGAARPNIFKYQDRRTYAWMMAAVAVVQVLLILLVNFYPDLGQTALRHAGSALVVVVALATGARLADAGHRRWIGIAVVLVLGVAVPLLAAVGAIVWVPDRDEALGVIALSGILGLVLVIILAVWAGTRPSARDERLRDVFGPPDDGAAPPERVEPRF